ncbi:helix-turn-helix domain-containing protein [Porphyromonas gingivalis]|uniref:Helix-turn-helix transcriptional regulator n=1 Tax=Porphyromonas gingivalis TaxID=837 RepID=A0AAE9X7C8_PORGN|nr:helix-turn-helix transcriptional regulator [Porphyromonas gingivalis]WCF99636.1 helix-turn-helix transcriptional regulator [Porphyromonas gingivalis]SJL19363.1 transcriptional regulator FimZ [Porphyromonas gingivalis]
MKESESFNSILEALNGISRICHESIFIVNFKTNQLIYESPSLIFIDEIKDNISTSNYISPYWNLIPKQEAEILLQAQNSFYPIFNSLSFYEKKTLVCVTNYHVKLGDNMIMIAQKFSPIELSSEGRLLIGAFSISNSIYSKMPRIDIHSETKFWQYNFSMSQFESKRKVRLSRMEYLILCKMAEGLMEKEISSDLKLSINTVKTHKKHIKEKMNVNTSNETLIYAQIFKLL